MSNRAAAGGDPSQNSNPVTRRQAIRVGVAAATVAAAAIRGSSEALAQPAGQPPTTSAANADAAAAAVATTQPSANPATPAPATTRAAAWITESDTVVLDKLTDQDHTEAQRAQIARGLSGTRNALRTVREFPLVDGSPPAFHFDPYAPGIERHAGAPAATLNLGDRQPPSYDGDVASLAFASIGDLHALLMARKVSSVDLTRMCLDRIKAIGPKLFAIITLMEDVALAQAAEADRRIAAGETGALLGIPYALKDLFAARGTPLTMGAKPFEHHVVDDDADIVRALQKAGAVLLCKTSLGEMGMGNVWYGGATRNPWNLQQGSSGSSAGSAAGVAAGLFPFAIGTETNGSIVSPCTVCGPTGLRPSFGRVSRGGGVALAWTMDKIGAIARYVEDVAIVFHTLHQPPADGQMRDASYRHVPFAWDATTATSLEGIRIGIDRTGFGLLRRDTPTYKESADAYDAAAAKIAELSGRALVDVQMPTARDWAGVIGLIVDCEGSAAFAQMRRKGELEQLAQQGDGAWPNVFRYASMIPAVDYLRAMQARLKLQIAMNEMFKDVDVIVATPGLGPSVPFCNLTGHPAVVTRCGRSATTGGPFSIQLIGRLDREDLILRVASAYERATDWHTRWPTL